MEGIKLRFNFAAISQRASRDTANISGAIYILNWKLLARRLKNSVVSVDTDYKKHPRGCETRFVRKIAAHAAAPSAILSQTR